MSLGSCSVVKNNLIKDTQAKVKKIDAAYEQGREEGEQSMQANVPVLRGHLKASSKATRLPSGIGFEMRSYGDEAAGIAYAAHVDRGHFVKYKDGSTRFIPPNPYYTQAVIDAVAAIREALRGI